MLTKTNLVGAGDVAWSYQIVCPIVPCSYDIGRSLLDSTSTKIITLFSYDSQYIVAILNEATGALITNGYYGSHTGTAEVFAIKEFNNNVVLMFGYNSLTYIQFFDLISLSFGNQYASASSNTPFTDLDISLQSGTYI